jgi:GntR family transcriptional regulator
VTLSGFSSQLPTGSWPGNGGRDSEIRTRVFHGTPVPPSQQLANLLREQIHGGHYGPGDRIPSLVSLAQEHGIAPDTAKKAVRILRDEGLVFTVRGYGTFVTEK